MQGCRTHIARFGDCLRLKFIFQRFLIAFLFLISFDDAIAQKLVCPYQIQVCVIGAQSYAEIAKPIEHAEIFIEKDHRKTFTDGNGMASFKKLCSQQVEIEIHFNGVHRHMSLMASIDPSKCHLIQLDDSLTLVKIVNKDSLPPTGLNITPTDKDKNNLPIGLNTEWTCSGADFGRIVVRLKHQPGIKTGSCEPGDTDVEVSFPYFIK
jgi:hypothetical protein